MIKTLFENKWVSLKEMSLPEEGVNGYSYLHEIRCHGKIISILPFRNLVKGKFEFYIRKEVTPCWGMQESLSSVTGGVEKDDIVSTTIHELEEETGYLCKADEIIKLGTCRGTKSVDTMYYLSAFDVTNSKQVEAKGDGSELEAKASMIWMNEEDLHKVVDPLVGILYLRWKHVMKS